MNCTYDNPETNIREYWKDGNPIYAEAKGTIEHLRSNGHSRDIEPWRSGVVMGNAYAMKRVGRDKIPTFHSKLKGLIKKYRSSDDVGLVEYIDSCLKEFDAATDSKSLLEKIHTVMKRIESRRRPDDVYTWIRPVLNEWSDEDIIVDYILKDDK